MKGSQRLLAMAVAATIFAQQLVGSARLAVVGVVAEASHASLGSAAASEGTTIYDGDRVSTDADGALRLVIGEAMVQLGEKSSVVLHDESRGAAKLAREFAAELLAGTATLSLKDASVGEIVAGGARIRCASEERGVVRVQMLGARELIAYAQRGAAEISYRGETETIPEGRAYRVTLREADDDGGAGGAPNPPTKNKKALLLVVIGAATAVSVGLALRGSGGSVESPDRP